MGKGYNLKYVAFKGMESCQSGFWTGKNWVSQQLIYTNYVLPSSGNLLNCYWAVTLAAFFVFVFSAGDIKNILETELQVPVSKMQLKGWKSGDVSDSVSMKVEK